MHVALTIAFSTWDGRKVRFTDDPAAWELEYGSTVPVIYDPNDPQRARAVRRRHGQRA